MKFEIKNRYTGNVQFTAEIKCDESEINSIKLGLSVKWAIKNGANLRSAYLYGANLYGADMRGANLSSANLYGAYLYGANLRSANLSSADMRGANLSSADLYGAYLYGANLRSANLSSADMRGANLSSADMRGANLSSANLYGAYLYGANLRGANLYVLQTDIWACYIQKEHIRIGCKYHPAATWFAFTDDEIEPMAGEALAWWKKWKEPIRAIHTTMEEVK